MVVWSDVSNPLSITRASGTFEAKGGYNGGDGGRIETLGHSLDTTGITVTAAAPRGVGGYWLIDPTDSTITQAIATGYQTTLNSGTSVINTVTGDITFSTNLGAITINKTSGGDATLTFKATGRITGIITSPNALTISSSSSKLNVVMNANSNANTTGGGIAFRNLNITTNGGNVIFGGGADPTTTPAVGYGSSGTTPGVYDPQRFGIYLSGGTINAGGGNISLRGKSISQNTGDGVGIWYNGATSITTSGTGTLTIIGEAANSGASYGLNVYNGSSVDGGTLFLKGVSNASMGLTFGNNVTIGTSLAKNITLESYYNGSNVVAASIFFGSSSTGVTSTIGNSTNTTLIDLITTKAANLSGGRGAISGYTNSVQFKGNGTAILKIRPGDLNTLNTLIGGGTDPTGSWSLIDYVQNGLFLTSERLTNGATGFTTIQLGRSDQSGATTFSGFSTTPLADNLSLLAGSGGLSITGNIATGAKNLSIVSAGGISQSGASTIIVGGTTSLTATGAITLANTGNSFTGSVSIPSSTSVSLSNSSALTLGSNIATGSGNIILTTNGLTLGAYLLSSSGTLTIQPYTSGTSIGISGGAGALLLPATYFTTNFVNGFSGITIGSATAGTITVGGATTLNDKTTFISGSSITLTGALNGAGETLTLTGAAGVSGAGGITAGSLLLNGAGSYTLNTASGNNVGTLAAAGVGNVSFLNQGALTIGTVGATSGINSTGTVNIATAAGDLTLSAGITTNSASIIAVTLNAEKGKGAGATSF